MKKILTVLAMAALTVAMKGAGDFTATLTQEEIAATGLSRLTPDELAKLKGVVERYKVGEALAKNQAKEDEKKAEVASVAAKRKLPKWLGTFKKSESKDDDVIETKLVGKLTNFLGRRTFTLENGQVWQMIEDGSYAGPALDSPTVTVRPGATTAFWLKIEEAPLRVKVKPIKLE